MVSKTNTQTDEENQMQEDYRHYLEVRTSLFHFGKFPSALEDKEERNRLSAEVLKQETINQTIQSSPEFAMVMVPEEDIEESLNEIYDQLSEHTAEDFQLEDVGLSHTSLRDSVAQDLRVAAVLNYVAEQQPQITDTDAELFYRMHPDRFVIPEKRKVRHILITINNEYKENSRKNALARINGVLEELIEDPDKFEDLAIKHSECPTALEGGVLGTLTTGQLYPELEAVLFDLEEGEFGPITESELGFHILLCETIEPQTEVPYEDVKEKIKQALRKRNQRAAQRKWLSERVNNN